MNPKLSPEERTELVLKQMTLDEKLVILHGNGMANNPMWTMPLTPLTNGGAGYVEGIKRLGAPWDSPSGTPQTECGTVE